MPLNGWEADWPSIGQLVSCLVDNSKSGLAISLELKTRGWDRGSSNQSEILHVDSYPPNEVFFVL